MLISIQRYLIISSSEMIPKCFSCPAPFPKVFNPPRCYIIASLIMHSTEFISKSTSILPLLPTLVDGPNMFQVTLAQNLNDLPFHTIKKNQLISLVSQCSFLLILMDPILNHFSFPANGYFPFSKTLYINPGKCAPKKTVMLTSYSIFTDFLQ